MKGKGKPVNKKDYLDSLAKALDCLSREKRSEILSFYQEAIDDRMEEGMSEEDAVCAMGPVESAAESILGELPVVPRAVAKTRRKSPALLWVLAIAGSPLWIPLAFAFLLAVASVYLCIWLTAACIWLVAAVCMLVLPFCLYLAWCGAIAGTFAFVLAQAGLGCVLGGSGLLVFNAAFSASRALAVLSQKWIRKAVSPFKRYETDQTCAVAA